MAIFCKKVKKFLKNLKTHSVGGEFPLLECVWLNIVLHLFIISCRVIDQLAMLSESRTVAGAIPGMLNAVVFEGTSEVWASGCSGGEESDYRIKSVDGKLRAQESARGIEEVSVWIGLPTNKVAKNVGGDHSVCHTPFVESCRHKYVRRGLGVLPDIGNIVERHTVLRCPFTDNLGVFVMLLCECFQLLPTAAFLARTVSASAEEQKITVASEG